MAVRTVREKLFNFFGVDLILLLSVFALLLIGVLFIYSSGITSMGVIHSKEFIRQILWAVSGLVLTMILSFLDYTKIKRISLPLYIGSIVVLIITLIFGKIYNGAKSWLGIGPFGIQPSEFTKITTILFISYILSENIFEPGTFKAFIVTLAAAMLPMLLILIQPDLGTAMVYIPIFLFIAFIGGIRPRYIIGFLAAGILTVFFVFLYAWFYAGEEVYNAFLRVFTDMKLISKILPGLLFCLIMACLGYFFFRKKYYYWIAFLFVLLIVSYCLTIGAVHVLKDYQMKRLIVFLDPEIDPRGAGWNINQSITAIGSGGPFGKGFLKGPQSHNSYVPQQSTDFIFSLIAEEIGFIGCSLIFILYIIIFIRSIMIAYKAKDNYGTLISFGVLGLFFIHFMENIGMAMGIMPVTGIPLLFLSYGGSSLWTALIAIGLLQSINNKSKA